MHVSLRGKELAECDRARPRDLPGLVVATSRHRTEDWYLWSPLSSHMTSLSLSLSLSVILQDDIKLRCELSSSPDVPVTPP